MSKAQEAYQEFRSKIDYEGGVAEAIFYGLTPPKVVTRYQPRLESLWNEAVEALHAIQGLLNGLDEEYEYIEQ